MIEPTFDARGYPSEETLNAIKTWRGEWYDLLDFVVEAWHFKQYALRDGRYYVLSTGGWSGNEDIIFAFMENKPFWDACWLSTHRGGQYFFRGPD